MPPRSGEEHPDLTVARLAAGQHGVVSRAQLLGAGISSEAISHRIAIRRLWRLYAGVYSVSSSVPPPGRYLAAVLACGERAVLSHRSAAALWGLRPPPSGPIDVTVPRRGSRGHPGIALHGTRSLAPGEVTIRDGVPCTTLARTLLDLAAVSSPRSLDRALEQALILRLFDMAAMDAVLARANGRRGVGTLRRLLARMPDEPAPTRNEFERRFLDLVRDAGLPMPVVNARVAGHEVDFQWPDQRLVVETDGRATHDTAVAFERDHGRDLDLELAGWHVVRITWRQLRHQPARVVELLRARLLP